MFTGRPSGFWTKRPLQKRNERGTVWVYPFSLLVSPFGKLAVATATSRCKDSLQRLVATSCNDSLLVCARCNDSLQRPSSRCNDSLLVATRWGSLQRWQFLVRTSRCNEPFHSVATARCPFGHFWLTMSQRPLLVGVIFGSSVFVATSPFNRTVQSSHFNTDSVIVSVKRSEGFQMAVPEGVGGNMIVSVGLISIAINIYLG